MHACPAHACMHASPTPTTCHLLTNSSMGMHPHWISRLVMPPTPTRSQRDRSDSERPQVSSRTPCACLMPEIICQPRREHVREASGGCRTSQPAPRPAASRPRHAASAPHKHVCPRGILSRGGGQHLLVLYIRLTYRSRQASRGALKRSSRGRRRIHN